MQKEKKEIEKVRNYNNKHRDADSHGSSIITGRLCWEKYGR